MSRSLPRRQQETNAQSVGAFMGAQSNGFLLNFRDLGSTFQDTGVVTPANDVDEPVGRASDVRRGPGGKHNATQSSGGSRPLRAASGLAFNGSAFLVLDYTVGTGSGFLAGLLTVAGSIGATQYIMGALETGPANRIGLALNTSGRLCAILGTQSVGTIFGGSDLRGREVAVCMTYSDALVRMYVEDAQVYSAARSGNPTTTQPLYVGALNNAGTASQHLSASVDKVSAGREFLTLDRWKQHRRHLWAP